MPQITGLLWMALASSLLFMLTEWLYHVRKVGIGWTRNLAYAGGGVISLFLPVYMPNLWWVLMACGIFQLFMVLTLNMGFLKSIHGVNRRTYGKLLYPMVIFIVYLVWHFSHGAVEESRSYAYFSLPILILSVCDPVAALTGTYYPLIWFPGVRKSLGGMLAFWGTAFLLSSFILVSSPLFHGHNIIRLSLFITTVATLTEFYSKRGFDNWFIPLSVLVSMYISEHFF